MDDSLHKSLLERELRPGGLCETNQCAGVRVASFSHIVRRHAHGVR